MKNIDLELTKYTEAKPHYLCMVVWRVLNFWLFPLLPGTLRIALLELFGAKIGKDCLFKPFAKIYAPWNLICGDAVCVGSHAEIYNKATVTIGNSVIVSQGAYLCTAGHDITSRRMALKTAPITIQDGVWVAAKAAVLPGVTLAEGSVVGACAVVTKDTDAWSVMGGNPARKIGCRKLTT